MDREAGGLPVVLLAAGDGAGEVVVVVVALRDRRGFLRVCAWRMVSLRML